MENLLNFQNPFITGQPALGSDFFGRADMLSHVRQFVQDSSLGHYFIFGKRRAGKTSLLKHIRSNSEELGVISIYINLQDKADYKENELATFFTKKIIANIELDIIISEKYPAIQFVEELLPILKLQKLKFLFLLDEFDVLCEENRPESSSELINFLHSISKKAVSIAAPVKLVIAAGENYRSEIQNTCAQFAGSGKKYFIVDFDKQTTKKLLKLSEPQIIFEKKAINRIYKLTGGNPYFTQCLAYKVYDIAESLATHSISEKMIDWQFLPTIQTYGSGAEVIWSRLDDFHKIILYFAASIQIRFSAKSIQKYIRQHNCNYEINTIEKALFKLERSKFLIEVNSNKYKFSIEFFRRWIILEISKEEVQGYCS